MSERPEGLPEFEDPPVDEVIIGVHFVPVPETPGALVAGYRETIKEEYPGVQYQPRVPPILSSGVSMFQQQGPIGIQFAVGAPDPSGRVWLLSRDESMLIQIQNDRFVHNWRHREGDYPRFETLEQTFWNRYREFRAQATSIGLSLHLRQLEVTYVNWVADTDMSPALYCSPSKAGSIDLIYAEDDYEPVSWVGNYVIKEAGVAVARLTTQLQGGHLRIVGASADRGSLFSLQFVAFLEPGISDDRIERFVGLGRKLIVQGFTSLTTPEAHDRWRRVQ